MRGKEAIVKLLEQAGVEVVFGLCGDTSLQVDRLVQLIAEIRACRGVLSGRSSQSEA